MNPDKCTPPQQGKTLLMNALALDSLSITDYIISRFKGFHLSVDVMSFRLQFRLILAALMFDPTVT